MPPISSSTRIIPDGKSAAVAKPLPNGHTDGHTNGHDRRDFPALAAPDPEPLSPFGPPLPGWYGPVGDVGSFLSRYLVFPPGSLIVVSAWTVAAWLADIWDKFPHLAVTGPEMRCGKSTLLDLLYFISPRSQYTTNISPAALYRLIEKEMPTVLIDEAQAFNRQGSESSAVIREMMNASIGRYAKSIRCGGERYEDIEKFSLYCPKAFALVGQPDGILADRSLPVPMRRKTKDEEVERFRSRLVEPIGRRLHDSLEKWAKENAERVKKVYDSLEPFDIVNDRMAELLLPLMAVLEVEGGPGARSALRQYLKVIERRDHDPSTQSDGVRLLVAMHELFGEKAFLSTATILSQLLQRQEEPWGSCNRGRPLTAEKLANLLRPYEIQPGRDEKHKARGYSAASFQDAWSRYLPAPTQTG